MPRGQTLGGWTAGSGASKRQADELAERMKPILAELAHLPSARQIAAELNRRGIKSATGGQWSSKTVGRRAAFSSLLHRIGGARGHKNPERMETAPKGP